MNKKIFVLILLIAVALGIRYLLNDTTSLSSTTKYVDIYNKKPTELGFTSPKWSGYLKMIPGGNAILVGGVTEDSSPKYESLMYMINLLDGTTLTMKGVPLEGALTNTLIVTVTEDNSLHIYDLANDIENVVPVDGVVYTAFISPDRTKIALNTSHGIRIVIVKDATLITLSTGPQDGAYAWRADGIHILGYHETSENLHEAGKGRVLTMWDTVAKTKNDLAVDFPSSALRYIEWLIPDKIARINAGFDDGSFDYLIDLSRNNFVTDLGETSRMLSRGGVQVSQEYQVVGLLGTKFDPLVPNDRKGIQLVQLLDTNGKELSTHIFKEDAERQVLRVIDRDTVAYVQTKFDQSTNIWSSTVYTYSFRTNREIKRATFNEDIRSLEVTSDKKALIIPTAKALIRIAL